MPDELTDLGVLGDCAECGEPIEGATWFWYADGGSVKLTYCRTCGPPDGTFEETARATAVQLTDDRTGDTFVRLIGVGEWFTEVA